MKWKEEGAKGYQNYKRHLYFFSSILSGSYSSEQQEAGTKQLFQ
jgi:hypothetical protein